MSQPSACVAAHDHRHCVADALTRAEALCLARGARLTSVRRRVLELVWSGHQPRGAYAILEDLNLAGQGQAGQGRTAPLTVYRALDFLVEQGLVHRIESLNAYIGCAQPGGSHAGQFLVCADCGTTQEIDDPRIHQAILEAAEGRGFRMDQPTVEVRGLCPVCQEKRR